MRAAVSEVANYFPTAIISGRSRDKVELIIKLPYFLCVTFFQFFVSKLAFGLGERFCEVR